MQYLYLLYYEGMEIKSLECSCSEVKKDFTTKTS